MVLRPELADTSPVERTASAGDRTATAQGGAPVVVTGTSELAAGLRLGHFMIEKKLGAGGMGEVYLAKDLALDRPVAIKVLPAGVRSGSARDRLIREARAQARVHHPNVGHIYFIGEEEGRLYFAMEYVTGQTLSDRLASGPVPVQDALAMIRSAVLGLREAQRSGFTHRDVKPSNLMIDGHGVLKVLDFGLAAGAPDEVIDGPVAQTSMAGTPLYMAPEQAHGSPVDFRADIYALGATLYHLVSGKPPFEAASMAELASLHETAARPAVPRGANPRTTIIAIDALIARMMAPLPQARFASYDELLRAIELASIEHTRPAGFLVRTIATFVDVVLVTILLGIVQRIVSAADAGIHVDRIGMTIGAIGCAVAIARWGTTAGKALLELEVVSVATSQRPTWKQAVLRECALAIAPVTLAWAELLPNAPKGLFSSLSWIAVGILLLELLHSSLRVPGKRAIWDRASGTMVRYRTRAAPTSPPLPR